MHFFGYEFNNYTQDICKYTYLPSAITILMIFILTSRENHTGIILLQYYSLPCQYAVVTYYYTVTTAQIPI